MINRNWYYALTALPLHLTWVAATAPTFVEPAIVVYAQPPLDDRSSSDFSVVTVRWQP